MLNFPELEKNILEFWKRNKIFEKSVEARPKKRQFVFYEGPPTANGKPGLHHVLARAFKDIICRYKTMQGFRVERKAGWDTHGLPVELEVEKELELKSKKDIEFYGIAQFNKQCRSSVWKYKRTWEDLTQRIGFWLDINHAYITYNSDYIETVWFIIKQIWQKGLLYQDFKVVPYCPRCGTSLSSHEVAQGYKKIAEPAIFVKFQITNSKFQTKSKSQIPNSKTYLLVWTTTPWTLPGNVALAVNPELDYVLVQVNDDEFVLAKDRLDVLGKDYKVIKEFKGQDLAGLEYEPLFDIKDLQNEKSHRVYAADFVTANEGTGIVHTATMYGVDDYKLGKKHGLPQKHTVDAQGRFNNLVPGFEGQYVKSPSTEKRLIDELKNNNLLFLQEQYEHDYPFCWRCDSPLLYYAKSAWFIKMTALGKELIDNNKKINWVPEHLREGRFGEWLREVKDWALSRERYWGTSLPIWQCQTGKKQDTRNKIQTTRYKKQFLNSKQCDNVKVIGSIKELERLSGKKMKDLHRPFIDKITFKCDKCGGKMKRVEDVIDCWFDAGVMPFGQVHWPFTCSQNQKYAPPKLFPADYISEAIDQTRGWFYTLLAVSTLLGFGPPYKNVVSLGHVLDEKGEKMSKSRGNVIDPWLILNRYGADASRWYFFTVNQPGDSKRVALKDIETALKKFLMTFWNCHRFFQTYALTHIPRSLYMCYQSKSKNVLDRWIISRLNELIREVTEKLDNYDITAAARTIEDFVNNDLSLWYIRRSRKRFQQPKTENDLKQASNVLGHILLTTAKLAAPFIPFLSEEIYRKLYCDKHYESSSPDVCSIHLTDWPKANKKLIDKLLDKKMKETREYAGYGLSQRADAGIPVRQPLNSLKIGKKLDNAFIEILREEVNARKVEYKPGLKNRVELDTNITQELKQERMFRESVRNIQEIRKNKGLKRGDSAEIPYRASSGWVDLEQKKKFISGITSTALIREKGEGSLPGGKEVRVGGESLWLGKIRIKK